MDSRRPGIGGRSGRIILLGDGSEMLTDGDDHEAIDQDDDDAAIASHHNKDSAETGKAREETPGPESSQPSSNDAPTQDVSSTTKAALDPVTKDTTVPEKLTTPDPKA